MREMKNYRYTDEQVAADWNLFCSLASDYVANYEGSFELLIGCKTRVRCGYSLTVPMVRAVMNCMLRDPSVVNLPEPAGPVRPSQPGTPRSFMDFRSVRRHHQSSNPNEDWRGYDEEEEEVVKIERPRYVEMPLKFKHDYGMVDHKQAAVVHRVHPDSYARWDTETGTATPVIWWRCKGYRGAYQMGKSKIIIMSSIEATVHILQSGGALSLCFRCRELAGGGQVLVEEVLSLVDRGQVGTADLHPLRTWNSSSRHRVG